jgi:predicted phosphate transport protein (TIGR00153 family)
MQWFHALMPKEEKFVELFVRHAETLVLGAGALRRLLDGGPDIASHCQAIMDHEHAADDVAREALQAVRRTFITPFDRSDIKELTSSLDDAIDQMQKTAKTILLFEVTEFQPHMREMGDYIVKAADLTLQAMGMMNKLGPNAQKLNALAEQITILEEKADERHDLGMKDLFLASRDANRPMDYIVGAEIYDHLEKVVDRFEDVANRISGILIENL